MNKVLNGFTVKDVQDFYDLYFPGEIARNYPETIYRDFYLYSVLRLGWIELYRLKDYPNIASVAIMVAPQFRRCAVGELLVNHAKIFMDDLEINRLEWYCDSANKASIALAKKCGFKFDKRLSHDDKLTLYYEDDLND